MSNPINGLAEDAEFAALMNLFQYHEPKTHTRVTAHAHVRQLCAHVAGYLNGLLPEGEAKDYTMIKLREVMFWGNHALAISPEPEGHALMPTAETISNEPVGESE